MSAFFIGRFTKIPSSISLTVRKIIIKPYDFRRNPNELRVIEERESEPIEINFPTAYHRVSVQRFKPKITFYVSKSKQNDSVHCLMFNALDASTIIFLLLLHAISAIRRKYTKHSAVIHFCIVEQAESAPKRTTMWDERSCWLRKRVCSAREYWDRWETIHTILHAQISKHLWWNTKAESMTTIMSHLSVSYDSKSRPVNDFPFDSNRDACELCFCRKTDKENGKINAIFCFLFLFSWQNFPIGLSVFSRVAKWDNDIRAFQRPFRF